VIKIHSNTQMERVFFSRTFFYDPLTYPMEDRGEIKILSFSLSNFVAKLINNNSIHFSLLNHKKMEMETQNNIQKLD
jgi:hypothetical protein